MTTVSLSRAVGLAALVTVASAPVAHAQETVLRAASFLPVGTSFGWPFARWVEAVNEECSGLVRIQILDAGAVNPFEIPNAVRSGVIDFASAPPSYYKGVMVEGDTTVLSNVPMAEQRANGAWELLNSLHEERMNVHYLTAFGDGVRFHAYTTRPAPGGDLTGFSMRTTPVYDDFFQALGADTVQIPPAEVYTALERRVVDGYGWPIWGIFDNSWDEFTTHVYEPGFYNVMVNQLVNLDRWRGMSDEQRGCLTEMAVWLEQEWPAWRDEATEIELARFAEAEIEVVDLGDEFREKADAIYWEALTAESPELVPQLRALLVRD